MSEKAIPTREELKKLKVVNLRQKLSKLSLPQGGLKDDLITRLLEHYQQAAAAAAEAEQAELDKQELEPEQQDKQPVSQEPAVPENQDQPGRQGNEDEPVEQATPEADPVQPEGQEEPKETPAEENVEEKGEEEGMEIEETVKEEEQPLEEKREEEVGEREGEEEKVEERGGEGEKVEEEGGEGEKMELSEDTPAHEVEEAHPGEEVKDSQPLREREGVKEDPASDPPPPAPMGPTSDQPHPLMEATPAEPHPVVPPTSENEARPLMESSTTQPRPLMETNFPVVEKPRPLITPKPPQVTSDYHSASDTPREEEVVAMATASHTGPVANDDNKALAAGVTEGAKEEGKRKKKKKRRRRRHDQSAQSQPPPPSKSKDKVEVEYIQEDILKPDDPYFRTFFRVFETFRIQEPEVKKQDPPNVSDLVARAALESKRLAAQRQDESDEEEEEGDKEQPKISKKKLRRMNRLSVAQLKQLVERPDVVEMHDVTAPDPKLLIHLKSTRNTVPVPRHWCFKRKYLQGKRGIEKPPFDLPDFIKATGVMEMRQALEDKEDAKSLKQKTRERVRPKMGKLTIDYQKLHDAFFKWQTKPKMSIHGDLYYEGKEFETRLRQKKPGDLSDELRKALGMPTGLGKHRFPPPWLVAMQRYGPPPSYPNLKIPGLNNPIPEGCSFGYFVGGWGKPPVDERGRPLYGDVFGLEGGENTSKGRGRGEEEDVDQTLWGELESEEEEEESEEEEEEEEESPKPEDIQAGLVTPVEGLATPSGLTSIPAGLETPEMIQLRKKKIEEAMEKGGETPALYTVLPEKTASVGGAMMGSSHVYDMASAVPGALKKASGSSHEGVEVTLDPSELDLDAAAMSARYEETLREQQGLLQKEDLSDMVAEHAAKQKKRKRPAGDTGGGKATKKLKEFKF